VVAAAEQTTEERPNQPVNGAFAGHLVPHAEQKPVARAIATEDRALVIGCGALARELVALTGGLPGVDVACLSPDLHNRPDKIPDQVRDRIRDARADGYERIFIAYADCGTGGLIDPILEEERVERLAGAHCYEFFSGRAAFAEMAEDEPATFWLTDFLARNFERLVIRGLGIDRHPELEPMYFANYRRLVYLSQTEDPELLAMARAAASRLNLEFEHRHVGMGELATSIAAFAAGAARHASEEAQSGISGVDPARTTSASDAAARSASEVGRAAADEVPTARTPSRRSPAGAELVSYGVGADR
jgi:hypothetical protein